MSFLYQFLDLRHNDRFAGALQDNTVGHKAFGAFHDMLSCIYVTCSSGKLVKRADKTIPILQVVKQTRRS